MLHIDRLKVLRKNKGMIQQEVADILKITRPAYVKYETGNSQPSLDTLAKLAEVFSVSTDYLLDNTDDPTPQDKKKPTPQTVGPALTNVLKEAGYNDPPITDDEAKRLLKYLRALRDADHGADVK